MLFSQWLRAAALVCFVGAGLPGRATAQVDPGADVVLQALALLDTPYRYGGRSPDGFDCSGLVSYVYGQATGLVLPRRSEDMSRVGAELERNALAPGDLVFFNTLGRRYSHVGIYIGEGSFIHAPARRGRVRVERLDAYWLARYNGARRLLAEPSVIVAADPAAASPAIAPAAAAAASPWGEGIKP